MRFLALNDFLKGEKAIVVVIIIFVVAVTNTEKSVASLLAFLRATAGRLLFVTINSHVNGISF